MIRQLLASILLFGGISSGAEARDVDLILVLATDVSESIDDNEYRLQKDGIVAALTDPQMTHTLEQCAPNGIALAYLEWSSDSVPVVGLSLIEDRRSLVDFAGRIAAAERTSSRLTNLIATLTHADRLIAQAPYHAARRVVDISSDGVQNDWIDLRRTARTPPRSLKQEVGWRRDDLIAHDVVVNALVIDAPGNNPQGTDGEPDLETYYRNNVIGGDNAFVRVVHSFEDYRTVFTQKLKREICNASAARDIPTLTRIARW